MNTTRHQKTQNYNSEDISPTRSIENKRQSKDDGGQKKEKSGPHKEVVYLDDVNGVFDEFESKFTEFLTETSYINIMVENSNNYKIIVESLKILAVRN